MVSINLEEPKLLTSTRFYAIFYFPEVAMLHTAEKESKKRPQSVHLSRLLNKLTFKERTQKFQ